MEVDKNCRCNLKVYNEKIVPKLQDIDIFLKENDTYSVENTSKILDLKKSEVLDLMKNLNIEEIDKKNFMSLMINGNSFICGLFRRELKCGSPVFYTVKDIAYIYNLEYIEVKNAFDFLSLDRVTSKQISLVLAQIN